VFHEVRRQREEGRGALALQPIERHVRPALLIGLRGPRADDQRQQRLDETVAVGVGREQVVPVDEERRDGLTRAFRVVAVRFTRDPGCGLHRTHAHLA
jgi:hypothetical protein